MRLLLFTNIFPSPRRPHKGAFNRELVDGLRAAGDVVRVIVPVPWTDLLLSRPAAPAASDTSYPVWWYPPRIGRANYHRWMARALRASTVQAARSWGAELVLSYWTHPDATVALEVARQLEIPGVVLAGGTDLLLHTSDPARRRIIAETLRRADRVLTVGAPLREVAIALGTPPERVATFERGVDRERFCPGVPLTARRHLDLPTDRSIVLWVGRMVPVKGLDVLVASWPAVAAAANRPLLLLAGDGEQRHALERQTAPLGDSVRFIGPVAHAALPDWYRAADCVVLPSRSEGTPNVLLEGLACGTPFVASAVGSVAALVDDESVAIAPGDAAALTAALLARVALAPMTRRSTAMVPDRRDAIASLRRELASVLPATRRRVAEVA